MTSAFFKYSADVRELRGRCSPVTLDANEKVHARLIAIYDSLYRHNGFGEMTVEVRILKKQQKEVIIKCGEQFRFVVDWKITPCPGGCPLCDHDTDVPL